MMKMLDLRRYHFTYQHGVITAYGTWVRVEEQWRPCLVLVRTGEENLDTTIPCIISGDHIWKWTEEFGDEVEAAKMCASFIDPLRMSLTKHDINKILTIVRWHAGDVVSIPPRPTYLDEQVHGEVSITDRLTGKMQSREVKLNV